MSDIAHYAVLRFQPYANRTEHANYGLVVFMPWGGVRVFIPTQLKKVKAMFPEIDLRSLQEQEETLPDLVGDLQLDDALDLLNAVSALHDQTKATLGRFEFRDQPEFSRNVALALASQVEATPAPRKRKDSRTRLFTDVRTAFKNLGILAPPGEQIPDHQVIENYSPDPEVELKVEFALQNGSLRLAQTIDLRADATALSKNTKASAYSKAFAMDYATRVLHSSALQPYVIVAGTEHEEAKKIMTALKRSDLHIVSWESRDDVTGFFKEWAEASGKPLSELPVVDEAATH